MPRGATARPPDARAKGAVVARVAASVLLRIVYVRP